MDQKDIRRLDRLVGTPACMGLTRLERVLRLTRRPQQGPPRKILFVKLIEMGATVLAAPAFELAAEMVGRSNIYLLCLERNRLIVDLLPCFRPENVLTVSDSSAITFARDLARVMSRCRRDGIDAAVDLEGLTRASAVITWLTGAERRAGYYNFAAEGPYRGRLFTHELGYTFHRHVSKMFMAETMALLQEPHDQPLLKETIPESAMEPPRFEPDPDTRADLLDDLERRAGGRGLGARRVVLNPNCGDLLPMRKWPEHRFVQLGQRLLAEHDDLTLIITGRRAERQASLELARLMGPEERVLVLAGETDLRQLVTLYGLCDVLVSSDSGPCHFATLTPVHVVALFGPETPALYGPLGGRVTSISAELACSPCLNILNHRLSSCTDSRCMQAITVERVHQAVVDALEARA